ncbi:MAG: 4Fe-4S dicluster domain-containing protein [Bacillota bacterium]|nr:4Fe-4S dicluster domain-containing protein [Bacillota bacterium]
MAFKILSINAELCTGCRACELVCSLSKYDACNPRKSAISIMKVEAYGIDLPVVCQHCDSPLCRDVCPVNALTRNTDTGAINLLSDVCIGCRACTLVCPYGAIKLDPDTGKTIKCDLCGGDPKCVKFCETGTLIYEKPFITTYQRQTQYLKKVEHTLLSGREID